jgi:hypothetical protein
MKWVKARWAGFTRGDRIALLLAETAIVAVCLALFPLSELTRKDWQIELTVYSLTFAFLQGVVVVVVAIIASRRAAATPSANEKLQVKTNYGSAVLVWLTIGLLYWGGGYVAEWMFPESEWATKWRYGLESDLSDALYVIDKHPHDCEFLSAPMGSKHCHYDKEVTTIHVRASTFGPQMSFDGKTWSPAEPGARPTVVVSWRRVEE